MRDHEKDEAFLREVLKDGGVTDTVYISENTYDGGYEVRCGTFDFFVDYEAIDDGDRAAIVARFQDGHEDEE